MALARRKRMKSLHNVPQEELTRRVTEGRKELQTEAAKAQSRTLPLAEREQALARMEAIAIQVKEADAEGRRRFPADAMNKALARQERPDHLLTEWEREARARQRAFEAEIAEMRRRDDELQLERRRGAGLLVEPPTWDGFQPGALAVLASRRIHGWLRGFAAPGEAVVDEYGEEVASAEQIAKRGGVIGSMINVVEVGTLLWAMGILSEHGDSYTFNPRQQNFWPDGLVNREGVLKRLRELHLLTFKVDGASTWTIGYGEKTSQEMQLFSRLHPLLLPDPPKKKRRAKRETAGASS